MNPKDKFIEPPKLNDLLDDLIHPNPHIRTKAYLNMVKHWKEDSLPIFINYLKADDLQLRRTSVNALGAFGISAIPILVSEFKSTNCRRIRASCLKALVQVAVNIECEMFPPDAMQVVKAAISDDSPEVILTVTSLLKQLGKQGVPLLLNICYQDQNVLRLTAAISALSEMNEINTQSHFKKILQTRSLDPLVKQKLVDCL